MSFNSLGSCESVMGFVGVFTCRLGNVWQHDFRLAVLRACHGRIVLESLKFNGFDAKVVGHIKVDRIFVQKLQLFSVR